MLRFHYIMSKFIFEIIIRISRLKKELMKNELCTLLKENEIISYSNKKIDDKSSYTWIMMIGNFMNFLCK